MTILNYFVFYAMVVLSAILFSIFILGIFDLRHKAIFKCLPDRLGAIILGFGFGIFSLFLTCTRLEMVKVEPLQDTITDDVKATISQFKVPGRHCSFMQEGKCFISRYLLIKDTDNKLKLCAKFVEVQDDGIETIKDSCIDYHTGELVQKQ